MQVKRNFTSKKPIIPQCTTPIISILIDQWQPGSSVLRLDSALYRALKLKYPICVADELEIATRHPVKISKIIVEQLPLSCIPPAAVIAS